MTDVRQFVFFDFEMLCAEQGMLFANMEAIRLGAVMYEIETETLSFFDSFIKPQQTNPLSNFCKNLTKIEDKDLISANDFPTVFDRFLTWVGENETMFFSWSSNDLSRIELDAIRHNISLAAIENIKSHYVDFQKVFSKRVSKTNPSVENALALYELSFEGEMHNPMYDAYNTLRIYLAFSKEVVKSDEIMINHFIFADRNIVLNKNINYELKQVIKADLHALFNHIQPISNLRSANKMLKRISKLVKKYENILINRSRIFDDETLLYVRLVVEFYQDFQNAYNEHHAYGCKIIILDEHMTLPLQKIAS